MDSATDAAFEAVNQELRAAHAPWTDDVPEELAHEATGSLLQIVDDILDFSKIEAGAIAVVAEPTAIRELMQAMVEAGAHAAARKGVRLECRLADDVPEWIVVEPLRLRQILGNLLGNAVKFIAARSVELAVSCGTLLSGGVTGGAAGVPDDGALRGVRVLVAEDQEINRWLVKRQFARLGVAPEVVEDGQQAFAAIAAQRFDLLVTDCHMPGMDGVELARRIRAAETEDGGRRLPILGLTADVTAELRARCYGAGMDDVVSKPINLRRLEAALRAMARRGSASAAPEPDPG